ncbi:MAG TPA: hypothetical protein VGO58_19395, partial [Chitinophagaceae bacterium]|nr:hypothetical protein [Chitinophagaceae bacterium]
MKKLFVAILLLFTLSTIAQVKIGDNPGTINSNSLLEMEATNKGFLPPRVAINNVNAVAPLTGTVPAGMLVFSTGGTVADGYYYWTGSAWSSMSQTKMVTKSANATLLKTETFVLASNDITLTLPAITAADDGLTITVKNIGSHTDQTTIVASGTSQIDGIPSSKLYRWLGRTFVAYNGDWIRKDKEAKTNGVFDVNTSGSWTTIAEALEFLDLHMVGPSVIRLSGEVYSISATEVIDLPYPLTIEGVSYGTTTIEADAGLQNTPMFRCLSEAYFKHIAFDATSLAGYGNNAGDDAIQLEGAGEYYEVKDCNFDRFNKAIVAESNIELWLFETDISNAVAAGVEIAAGVTTGVKFTTSECDFDACAKGINLKSGIGAVINVVNCTFYNGSAGGVGVNYVPATFTTFNAMFITNNAWDNGGTFFSGFDFSRSDARDAKAFIQNNAGDGDKNPSCNINVLNNAITTTLTALNTWYKASWNYLLTTFTTTKWTVTNATGAGNVNRIT